MMGEGIYYMPWKGEGKDLTYRSRPFFVYIHEGVLLGQYRTVTDAERAVDRFVKKYCT